MPLVDMKLVPDGQPLSPVSTKEGRKPTARQGSDGVSSSKPRKEIHTTIWLLLVELCEKFTFFGIVCNMILFCTIKLGYPNHQAATINLCFVGACMVTPLLMGWLAQCLVERSTLAYICAFLHFVGTALLPVVAFPFEDFFIDKHYVLHTLARREQQVLFYVGLSATCLGSGGIRAIVCPLSVYDLDAYREKELLSFFNWFYWLENLSSAIVLVIISYIQQSVAKNLGFLIPFVSVLMALITIHMARSEMIYQPPKGNGLLTVCGVVANALRVCCVKCRYFSGDVTNWLDHAKENYGGQYSETQVESTKLLVRLFPFIAFQILYRICVVQIPSGYYLQAMNSNLNLNGFLLPVAAMNVISILPFLILAPVLECLNTCLFSPETSGRFPAVCIGSFITYKFVPGRIRGVALQALTFFNGAGCIMEALLVQAAYTTSQGDWFPNILNEGKLERFYFFLASLMMINTLGFWTISHRYTNLQQDYDKGFRGSLLQEQLLQHEKSLIFYDSILDCPSPLSPVETLL
ncbi:solute carrier family 15 member 5 isoform X2 [Lacerta agilis]|uniref:solute carrier family 15 member 5 isoform X2 n=1 Tax=Lacerta agilis TaxID=80427 RepID=UPI0014195594|nr:solute carrier family 15 member 5 isoform X2 [Lacerta agilis]